MDSLWPTTPEQTAFYAEQVKSGKGVGIDEQPRKIANSYGNAGQNQIKF